MCRMFSILLTAVAVVVLPQIVAAQEAKAPPEGRPLLPVDGLPNLEHCIGPQDAARGGDEVLWDAFRALEQGRSRMALRLLRKLAADDPGNFLAHLYLGWATYVSNPSAVKLAERCILEASRLEREAPEPFLLMSEICTYEGDDERAAKFAKRGDHLRPLS